MSNMEFGLPSLRVKKEEKYVNEGVLTFLPIEGKGSGRKMILNQKALEMLEITDDENQISFSFTGAEIYIVNTSGCENCSGLKVGKTTNGFTDKKHYEFIKTKTFDLKEEDTLELLLEETNNSFNGKKVFKLIEFLKGSFVNSEDVKEDVEETESVFNNTTVSDEQEDSISRVEQLYNN